MRSFFLLMGLSMFAPAFLSGQIYKEAKLAFEQGNYFESIELYSRLVEKDPQNAEYQQKLGMSYLKTFVSPKKALNHLLLAEKYGYKDPELLFYIAKAHTFHLDYDQALLYLFKFRDEKGVNKKNQEEYDKMRRDYLAAQDLLKYPVNVSFFPAGLHINSPYPDYHPFVTRDGKTLYFTSRRKLRPGDKPEFDGYYPSDIFFTSKENGNWKDARRIDEPVNSPYDEQGVGITNFGDTLFYYIDHVDEYGDIFYTVRLGNKFDRPKALSAANSDFIESACSISNDGKTLIFSSNRDGGQGQLDIWMTRKTGNGTWESPFNLGSNVNTSANEDFPTLSGDGKTLYFCSTGHPGMGGYDLFFSTWDEQNKVWTKPQNIGYPINTPHDDKTISFVKNGNTAFVTGIRDDGQGDLDIYRIEYNRPESKDPAIFLINIPEAGNIEGSAPQINVKNQYDELIGSYLPNRITGRYVIALYPGKYFLSADAKGYPPYNEVLVVNNYHTRQDHNVKIIDLEK